MSRYRKSPEMAGPFAQTAYDFIQYKRSCGFKYENEPKCLSRFCRFAQEYGAVSVREPDPSYFWYTRSIKYMRDNYYINQADNDIENEYDNDNDSVHTLNDVQDETISIFNAYNSICTRLPRAEKMTVARAEAIKTMLQDYSVDDIKNVFNKANKSDFLSGLTTGGFRAGFDFVLQPDKFIRILEGQYDNRKSSANQGLLANDYDIDAIEKILLRNP